MRLKLLYAGQATSLHHSFRWLISAEHSERDMIDKRPRENLLFALLSLREQKRGRLNKSMCFVGSSCFGLLARGSDDNTSSSTIIVLLLLPTTTTTTTPRNGGIHANDHNNNGLCTRLFLLLLFPLLLLLPLLRRLQSAKSSGRQSSAEFVAQAAGELLSGNLLPLLLRLLLVGGVYTR